MTVLYEYDDRVCIWPSPCRLRKVVVVLLLREVEMMQSGRGLKVVVSGWEVES